MSLINKPDYEVFASNARDGEVLPIPNVLRGWGETILLTEKIPPMEWFNWLAKRQDEWLLYLTQQGISEWSEKVTYPTAAIAKFNGLFYVSIKETKSDNPATTQSAWKLLTEYFNIDGKLDKKEVKQTIGQSTTSVMSQKAVTDALGKKLNTADLLANTASFKDMKIWRCGDTGLVMQWGFVQSSSVRSIQWNEPFDNDVLSVAVAGADQSGQLGEYCFFSKTRFGAKVSASKAFTWIAIGY